MKSHLNFDRLLILSIGFLLLFTSFNTAQGLAAIVLKDDGLESLGFYSLGLLYCVFGISSFFATSLVKILGEKTSLLTGAICYSVYVASFIMAALRAANEDSNAFIYQKGFIKSVILVAAAINGFGASILWVAQGKYISECADEKNKGLFNSVFWAFFMTS